MKATISLPKTRCGVFVAAFAATAFALGLHTFGLAEGPCTPGVLECWTQDCPGLSCIPVETTGGGTTCITMWDQGTPWCCKCTLTTYLCREDWDGPQCGTRYERIFTSERNSTCARVSGECVRVGG